MTGPEHYQEAERHLRVATELYDDGWHERAAARAGFAHVHATLAMAAATAADPANLPAWSTNRIRWEAVVLDDGTTQWICDGCGHAMTTAPGGRVPDPPVCDTCWRAGIHETRKSA